jgi:hypothetical protein
MRSTKRPSPTPIKISTVGVGLLMLRIRLLYRPCLSDFRAVASTIRLLNIVDEGSHAVRILNHPSPFRWQYFLNTDLVN